jgi:hypothetical protein
VFGTGVAIAAGLWGWARPNWGCCWGGRYGGVNVNVNRWNAISANRPWRGPNNGVWRPNNPEAQATASGMMHDQRRLKIDGNF